MTEEGRNVFITGAGFSASAKLPIQDKILQEMMSPTSDDILSYTPESESVKFLIAYINVGLYLLENYTAIDSTKQSDLFLQYKKDEFLLDETSSKLVDRYVQLQKIKESVREALISSEIQISLEDVFTSFDKSYQSKEYFHKYSYHTTDDINEHIIRLFVYYFCKCGKEHSYDNSDYIAFCNYIRHLPNVSIISTNWDVLIEEYFTRQKISYNLCLNEPYYYKGRSTKKASKQKLNLIKLHGSINWVKCLSCGTIQIVEHKKCGDFLFDDGKAEKCMACQKEIEKGCLLQSQIITPTMMKSINSQLYSNLWAAAKRDLRAAKKVTFIGYSLPTADFELRYLLHRTIPSGIPIDVVLYHDDNPSQTDKDNLKRLLPEKRYRDLFAKNKISFFYDGFGDYFREAISRTI